jgi:hypothetical protein
MAFTRIALGWGLVALLFLLWEALARRIAAAPDTQRPSRSSQLTPIVVESLLLTLFAGLWFGSLGSGGALILFLIVGLLMEVPHRLRTSEPISWKSVLASLVRIEIAGVILSLVLAGRIV